MNAASLLTTSSVAVTHLVSGHKVEVHEMELQNPIKQHAFGIHPLSGAIPQYLVYPDPSHLANPQCRLKSFLLFSYTTHVILSAGATFSRFGVRPLYKPLHPSLFIVLFVASQIPVYVGGCITVPCVCNRVRTTFSGYTTDAPNAPDDAPMMPVAMLPGFASSSWQPVYFE